MTFQKFKIFPVKVYILVGVLPGGGGGACLPCCGACLVRLQAAPPVVRGAQGWMVKLSICQAADCC